MQDYMRDAAIVQALEHDTAGTVSKTQYQGTHKREKLKLPIMPHPFMHHCAIHGPEALAAGLESGSAYSD